jgi:5'-deoxynucleotidase YfbR-like HD superfamily hydrolase
MIWRDPNAELLAACVTHDLGEYVTGDVPYGSPNKDSNAELDALEDMGMLYPLCPEDSDKLKLLDLLDAYLWARHHAPFAMVSHEWIDHREKVLELADKLGVSLRMFGME